jgi:hypothetical protein
MSAGTQVGTIISAGLASVLGIYKIIDFGRISTPQDDSNPFARAMAQAVGTVGTDIGLYLVVIAGIVVPAIAIVMRKKSSVANG